MKVMLSVAGAAVLVIFPAACAQDIPGGRLAFLKENELYFGNVDGSALVRATRDGVRKSHPRWSPDGSRVAYRSPSDPHQAAMAHISIVTAEGNPVGEILFRPETPGVLNPMRYLVNMQWLDKQRIGLQGSINPNNCEYVWIDVAAGKEVDGYYGLCGSFIPSPDNLHIAYSCAPGIGVPPEDYRQSLDVDGMRAYTPPQPNGRLLSDAVWSPDSSSVAVLEHDLVTKARNVVLVALRGAVTRVPLPASLEMPMELRWVGNRLTLEANGTRHVIDLERRTLRMAGPDIEELLERETQAIQRRVQARQRALELARKLGADQDEEIDVYLPDAGPE